MQQVLAAHQIPTRVIDLGSVVYFGLGSPAALQVRSGDQWTALLLLSAIEETDQRTDTEADGEAE
jgi:hypothetical protein